jgi:hypothetical protein
VIYCGVTSPYLISTHPAKGDESSGGDTNFNAPRSYTRRGRDFDRISVGVVTNDQIDDEIERYVQYEGHA